MLKPLDVVVLAWMISADRDRGWTQVQVAHELGIAQSSVHRALRQVERSGLWHGGSPRGSSVHEFLVHGVRYVYPPDLGTLARGLPTAHAGPGLAPLLAGEHPYVWPSDLGRGHGSSLQPLHPCVPAAALTNPPFYEFMSIVDSLRVGRARERQLASERLAAILGLVP